MMTERADQQNPCGAACGCAADEAVDIVSGIDRRAFLVRGALAAAALALAACGGANSDSTAPSSVSLAVKVSDYPELDSVGGIALVNASGSPLAIVRTGTSTFIALSRICPHQGATVNTSSGGFTCPRHGARFNTTGTWIGGQSTSSLRSYPTSYNESTGTITIG
jgi:nitrite reductase/ring-hydroxylating ferredoxin subunit